MTQPFPTTIVVPLYGDLPTAERCITSVLENVDLTFHRLLIINDCGPDADMIEAAVLGLVADAEGVTYHRNPENLGFVGTCNRAATELDQTDNDILLLNSDAELMPGTVDELSAVLHLSEKHGVVTARSNHATIATIPFRPRGEEASAERSRDVFSALWWELPRYSIVPVAHGFCFLARRSLIRNYGLFDEVFAPGYGEENDFCLRVNDYGFSSVMANHAYAHHEGEKSFSSLDRSAIQDAHERKLNRRYPHYQSAVSHYIRDGIDTVDWFADFLVPSDAPRRILIDLHHMSLIYNGSVQYALSFLSFLQVERESGRLEGLEFVIATSSQAIDFFQLRRFGLRVVPNEHLDELFDLGFSLAPLNAVDQIERFDRFCVRWVASVLDIIAIRSLPLLESDYSRRQVVFDSLEFADEVIAISQATIDDAAAYYPSLGEKLRAKSRALHLGVEPTATGASLEGFDRENRLTERQRSTVRNGGYVLIVGNTFFHKQLREAVAALRGGHHTVIAFGSPADDQGDNIVPLPSGYLTDDEVGMLYDSAAVMMYPSAYEGFGLPLAEASRHGKPIVAFDTQVAHEVIDALGLADSTRYFATFDELSETLDVAKTLPAPHPDHLRTPREYNEGVLRVIREALDRPVDLDHLRRRVAHFRAARSYQSPMAARAALLEWKLTRRSYRVAERVVSRLEFLRPLLRSARRVGRRPGDNIAD